VLAAQHKALTDEKRKIEAAKRRAQAERKRVEDQTRKAKAAREAEQKRVAAVAAAAAAKAAEDKKRKQEAAEREAEEQRKRAEAEERRMEEERKRAEAEERRKLEEKALREQMALEQAQLDAQRARLRDRNLAEYIGQIQATVNRNWIRPPGATKGLKCTVKVAQIPGGEVIRVVITKGSGNVAFDRSVENAVLRSSPLPQPKDPSLFDREIKFEFEPED
jgi:colicin import membrane protein